jgi:hypothetical protein
MAAIFNRDIIFGLISSILTLMVLSYLIKDNPAFRIAVYIFVGVSAGYAAAVAFRQVIWPKLFLPLLSGSWDERLLSVFPLILGVLLLMKLSPRTARLGTPSIAFMTGVGAATAIAGAVVGTLFPQTQAAINAFNLADSGANWPEHLVEAFFLLVGTVTTLVYFHYGAKVTTDGPRRGKLILVMSWVGQVFIAITYGVLFAGVFTAALTAMIERWHSIVAFLLSLKNAF